MYCIVTVVLSYTECLLSVQSECFVLPSAVFLFCLDVRTASDRAVEKLCNEEDRGLCSQRNVWVDGGIVQQWACGGEEKCMGRWGDCATVGLWRRGEMRRGF